VAIGIEPKSARNGGNVRTGADQPRSLSVIGIPGRRVPYRRLGIDEQRKRAARSLAQIALIWRSCRTGDRSGGTQIDLRRRLADVIELAAGTGRRSGCWRGRRFRISRR
jgi:hypothetical protein